MLRRLWQWLRAWSLPEWRLHPWRQATVALAVALGVALAFSVQLINASALSEFAGAVRAANGDPDVTIAARTRDGFDDALFASVAADAAVRVASPVVELDAAARRAPDAQPLSLRVLAVDALRVAMVAPSLLPRPDQRESASPLVALDPDVAFVNLAAASRLHARAGDTIELRGPTGWQRVRVAGSVAVGGAPLVLLDIAAAQARLGMANRLSRIDLRLQAGVDAQRWLRERRWPDDVRIAAADEAEARVSNLSRAYRVNLSVLALVALLVGGFLVYSVLALSVAQRTPTFALLGVLGLTASERRAGVLSEAFVIGAAGSAIGLVLGTALAWLALRALGGDLGGGYFPGVAPALQFSLWTALGHGALGIAAALAGAWWPARAAERLSPAQALKGLSSFGPARSHALPALALLAIATGLALLPPWRDVPLAAYASVAAWLAGGVALVPVVVQALLARRPATRSAPWLLAWQRARHQRHTASAAVAGVVASTALSVALLVMVGSFREAVAAWLDGVLPAELYLRTVGGVGSDVNTLSADVATAAASVPGVARVRAARVRTLSLDATRPPLTVIVRPIDAGRNALPWLGEVAVDGADAVFVSEPAAALYDWHVGDRIVLPLPDGTQRLRVQGIWRDYARQFGALAIDSALWRRHGGDDRLNELALWLQPGADARAVIERLRALAGADMPVETASAAELRALSLAIFDRSFAVTRYLQAVAIAVGLIGVAASLSAQVLARRKEFGLLVHLGLTRAQVLAIVTGEAAAWLLAGVALGVAIGLVVSVVLVDVVNPQSFHWTMPLHVPWLRLALLAAVVLALGTGTAAFSARRAASRSAVMAVKEDW